MKIVVDAFGGDHAPREVVGGAITAVNLHEDIEIILTGDTEKIKEQLQYFNYQGNRIQIVHAPDVITNDDVPTSAIKNKKESSLVVALDLLKTREDVCGLVSAGSTGAVLAGALLKVGRLKGVARPALAPELPNAKGGKTLLIDCGANVDSKPQYLQQFALMGDAYMKAVHGIENPRIALLSNGVEDKKGNELVHEAFALLKQTANINFVGNMEARDLLSGDYDIVVADGFAGNIALKSSEGAVQFVLKEIKSAIMQSGLRGKLGALLLKKVFAGLKKKLNYSQSGGSPFLGVQKLVIKSHGSSKAVSIYESIMQVYRMHNSKMIENLQKGLQENDQIENG